MSHLHLARRASPTRSSATFERVPRRSLWETHAGHVIQWLNRLSLAPRRAEPPSTNLPRSPLEQSRYCRRAPGARECRHMSTVTASIAIKESVMDYVARSEVTQQKLDLLHLLKPFSPKRTFQSIHQL